MNKICRSFISDIDGTTIPQSCLGKIVAFTFAHGTIVIRVDEIALKKRSAIKGTIIAVKSSGDTVSSLGICPVGRYVKTEIKDCGEVDWRIVPRDEFPEVTCDLYVYFEIGWNGMDTMQSGVSLCAIKDDSGEL